MTLAVTFTDSITLGAVIIAAAGGLAGLAWFAYGAKWKSAYQVASTQTEELRKALADERSARDRCDERLQEAMNTMVDMRATIERLEALPNLERLVTLMSDTAKHQDASANERLNRGLTKIISEFDQRLLRHEDNASERHEAQLAALSGIAATMTRAAERLERRS